MRSSNITPTARIRSSMGDMTMGETFDKFSSPLNEMKLGLYKERVAYHHQELSFPHRREAYFRDTPNQS
jgi:hypothetical protein